MQEPQLSVQTAVSAAANYLNIAMSYASQSIAKASIMKGRERRDGIKIMIK